MAIARAQAGNTGTANASPLTLTLTSAPTPGNLMTVCVSGNAVWSGPAGWTKFQFDDVNSDVAIFYRVVQGGDGTSYNFTNGGAAACVGRIDEWTGPGTSWITDLGVSAHSTAAATSTSSNFSGWSPGVTAYTNEFAIGVAGFNVSETSVPWNLSLTNDTTNLLQGTRSLTVASRILTSSGVDFSTLAVGTWTTSTATGGFAFATFASVAPGGMFVQRSADPRRLSRLTGPNRSLAGGTFNSDATFSGSVQQTPARSLRQFLELLQPRRMAALLKRGSPSFGGTIQSDATFSATGSVTPTANLMARMRALAPREGITLPLPNNISIVGGTISSASTFTGQVYDKPPASIRQLIDSLQKRGRAAVLSRQFLSTGGTIASDATFTGTAQGQSLIPTLQWIARLHSTHTQQPVGSAVFAGGTPEKDLAGTIQSDSTLAGTLTNLSAQRGGHRKDDDWVEQRRDWILREDEELLLLTGVM